MASNSTCGQLNTDVSGVGVRVSLYCSVTIGLVMMRWFTHNMDAFQDAARTSFITSIALVISALISLYRGTGLALVDGLVVTSVTSLVMAYAFIVGSQGRGYATGINENDFLLTWTLTLAALLHTALWMAFGLIVWLDPVNFGGIAIQQCSPNPNLAALFWIFWHRIPITSPGLQAFAKAVFGFAGAMSILMTIAGFFYSRAGKKALEKRRMSLDARTMQSMAEAGRTFPVETDGRGPSLERGQQNSAEPIPLCQLIKAPGSQDARDARPSSEQGVQSTGARTPSNVKPCSAPIERSALRRVAGSLQGVVGYGGVFAYVYLIITTESVISVNGQREATNSLTFGQILSLVLLLDQIVFQPMSQIFDYLVERAGRNVAREMREEAGRRLCTTAAMVGEPEVPNGGRMPAQELPQHVQAGQ